MKKKVLYLLIVIVSFLLVNVLIMPKYVDNYREGSMIDEYYDETVAHDVIFIGDCEVYTNFNPITLYEKYGISSYIRGTPQQMMWQSYYILKETIKYEMPKVVVLNVNALRNGTSSSSSYNHLTADKMKWSMEKYQLIKESLTDEESIVDYTLPIFRYHERLFELNSEDFKYFLSDKKVSHNGFLIETGVEPVSDLPTKRELVDYSFPERSIKYLDKIAQLCLDNEIKLILIKAPSLYPYWYEQYDTYVEQYAEIHNLDYYNFLDAVDEIGLDYSSDTYDAGLHLNYYGSVKLSKYFGNILSNYDLIDYRNDEIASEVYAEKIRLFYNELEERENEK